jgi:HD superfamily phosphohydrolase
VYFHKSTRAAETMIRSILRRVIGLVAAGERLPVHLAAVDAAASGVQPELDAYLELDDQSLLGAMHAWERASDPVLADLTRRIRSRSLFKTIELGHVESDRDPAEALAIAQDIARQRGLDPEAYVALDRASDTPLPAGAELRVIFPDGRARDLADVSFLLARLQGQTLERTRIVFAAELRDDLRRALVS